MLTSESEFPEIGRIRPCDIVPVGATFRCTFAKVTLFPDALAEAFKPVWKRLVRGVWAAEVGAYTAFVARTKGSVWYGRTRRFGPLDQPSELLQHAGHAAHSISRAKHLAARLCWQVASHKEART